MQSIPIFTVMLSLLVGCQEVVDVGAPEAVPDMVGINFSALGPGQAPGDPVSAAQIGQRLDLVAPHVRWVRTFGSQNEARTIAELARERGLKVAMGAWLTHDATHNERELEALITLANDGLVDLAIVGSEVLYRKELSETELVVYLRRVRQAVPDIQVATADIYRTFLDGAAIARETDVLLYNSYPYWEGIDIDHAVAHFHERHQRIVAIAGEKPVWVSETGWPTAGRAMGASVPSLDNQLRYFQEFRAWARVHEVPYFWFASFDEGWKSSSTEGEQGAHWGLWDERAQLKADYFSPGVDGWITPADDYLRGERKLGGEGEPRLELTRVPALGTLGQVEGLAYHVRPKDVHVAVFLQIQGAWWTRPLLEEALTPVWLDGAFRCRATDNATNANGERLAVYLLPATYTPPLLEGWSALPAELAEMALDTVIVDR